MKGLRKARRMVCLLVCLLLTLCLFSTGLAANVTQQYWSGGSPKFEWRLEKVYLSSHRPVEVGMPERIFYHKANYPEPAYPITHTVTSSNSITGDVKLGYAVIEAALGFSVGQSVSFQSQLWVPALNAGDAFSISVHKLADEYTVVQGLYTSGWLVQELDGFPWYNVLWIDPILWITQNCKVRKAIQPDLRGTYIPAPKWNQGGGTGNIIILPKGVETPATPQSYAIEYTWKFVNGSYQMTNQRLIPRSTALKNITRGR